MAKGLFFLSSSVVFFSVVKYFSYFLFFSVVSFLCGKKYMNTLLLDALRCKNKARPPVWIMRQAGRYLPEYQALRAKYSLWDLFHNPELAAQVTLMPVERLNTDAAILFSDILVIAEAFGKRVDYIDKRGPVLDAPIRTKEDIENLKIQDIDTTFSYIKSIVRSVKQPLKVPLIGFCGGPFTVAHYMFESHDQGKEWIYRDPQSFHLLLEKITEASIAYLRLQIEAGVQAIQIFDSWANLLTSAHFSIFSLHYIKQIIDALRGANIPIIFFSRGSSLFPQEIANIEPNAISFDWQGEMSTLRSQIPKHIAIQGNFDPHLLFAPPQTIIQTVKTLLTALKDDPGFIVNLGHGVLPATPVDNVKHFIDTVKNFDS